MLNRPAKVMLIDDNEIDLRINSKIITLANLFDEIITFTSGEESLDYLSKNVQQPKQLPNFILLDIQMPEMDGFEFLEHFSKLPKSLTNNCPVAMLSSTLDFGDIKRAEANLFVVKLLKKPLLPTELAAILNR